MNINTIPGVVAYIQNNFCLTEDISAYKWGHVLKVYLGREEEIAYCRKMPTQGI